MTNYTVQAGDNLTKIAKAHNTTVENLATLNKISNPNKISVGQKLIFETERPKTEPKLTQDFELFKDDIAGMDSFQKEEKSEIGFGTLVGTGVTGALVFKGVEKALPHAINAGKKGLKATKSAAETIQLSYMYGKDALKEVKNSASSKIKQAVKHASKKAELEYAFGKDALKEVKNSTSSKIKQAVKHASKKAELEYAFGKDAVKQTGKRVINKGKAINRAAGLKSGKILKYGKAGKLLGRTAAPVAAAISAIEVYDAYKTGGTTAAVKQGTKCASGLVAGATGAKIGAMIGACTGPVAPVAVPVLAAVGGIAGYLGGEKIADTAISWFN